jgi:mannobiose 2-epimerase
MASAGRRSLARLVTPSVDLRDRGKAGADPPAPRSLTEARALMRRILVENVQPFWLAGVLDPAGGYRLHCDVHGRWLNGRPKRLVTQARTLWFLARLMTGGDRSAEVTTLARQGFLILEEGFWDRLNGGFHWELDTDGRRPTRTDKHAYGQAQALYALSEYALATGCGRAADLARATFELLENRFHDADHGGYLEHFLADWTPAPPGGSGLLGTPSGPKTANTHLHLLEALTVYLRLTPDERARPRLAELAEIVGAVALHPAHATLVDCHERDWRPAAASGPQAASYGHDLEIVHLLAAADRELGLSADHRLDLYRRLADHALRWGEDRSLGGFWSSGPPGQPAGDRRKIWWTQAEALLAVLELHRLTGEQEFADVFLRTLGWIGRWQVDWSRGEWHAEIAGGRACGQKASPWKGPYHNGRALIQGLEILDEVIGPK